MFPIPKHLENILKPLPKRSNQFLATGNIECSCGHNGFNIFYLGEIPADKPIYELKPKKLPHGSILIINSKCSNCAKENLIFDNRIHGHKVYLSNIYKDILFPNYELDKWICSCKKETFEIGITIRSEEIDNPKKNNLKEEFDWFAINLTCKDCKQGDVWLDYNSRDDI